MDKDFQIIKDDPWLAPYEVFIDKRYSRYQNKQRFFKKKFGSLLNFASWHHEMGFQTDIEGNIIFREWAPRAEKIALIGDFNNWDETKSLLQREESGIWSIFLPKDSIQHGDQLKLRIWSANGTRDRIPSFIKRAVQDEESKDFKGQYWVFNDFKWSDNKFKPAKKNPLIYECHIGMAQEKDGVGTFKEFELNVLPRIKDLGYNYIQLMAIKEHPYYGSFGYHVSNFYAVSSRFGTPEDLKSLINVAHNMGIGVIMDLVHSHAVKNMAEGLNDFDGSGNQYFHSGDRGYHKQWDSLLFDYGKEEVLRFLCSNLKFWLEEYHFDGFRFDGVTSMLYHHHGDFVSFDHYDKYFVDGVDDDAVTYLQLANKIIHKLSVHNISIAEDMSGMPGICRKQKEGGIGFDFRLGMGVPDNWIKLLKNQRDEEWDMEALWNMLTNRRWKEKTIAYVESHDQAMVGDKTTAFWLMDEAMYYHMSLEDDNLIIDRGIQLHKMLRGITALAAGEAYMNFIGNEFGHPEWIDFPREGNNWSYHYARRQWSLVDNPKLKYQFLNNFDKELLSFITKHNLLNGKPSKLIHLDNNNKVIGFEKAGFIVVFSFSPNLSIADYTFFVPLNGTYQIVFNSDDKEFGGHGRLGQLETHKSIIEDGVNKLSVYLPNRTMLIFKRLV